MGGLLSELQQSSCKGAVAVLQLHSGKVRIQESELRFDENCDLCGPHRRAINSPFGSGITWDLKDLFHCVSCSRGKTTLRTTSSLTVPYDLCMLSSSGHCGHGSRLHYGHTSCRRRLEYNDRARIVEQKNTFANGVVKTRRCQ